MLYEELTWSEIEEAIEKEFLIILPLGSLEQHGPHLPVATDLYSVFGIGKEFVKTFGSSILAPPLYYGYTRSMTSFPGTLTLQGKTLIYLLRDIVGELLRQGFKKILLFNGHYENLPFIEESLYLLQDRIESARIIVTNWWDLIPDYLVGELFTQHFKGWEGVHASFPETSVAMYLKPDLVRVKNIVDDKPEETKAYQVFPLPPQRLPKSGVFTHTTSSSPEAGEIMVNEVLKQLSSLVKREFFSSESL